MIESMDEMVDFEMLDAALRALNSETARGAAEAIIVQRRPIAEVCAETGLTAAQAMEDLRT